MSPRGHPRPHGNGSSSNEDCSSRTIRKRRSAAAAAAAAAAPAGTARAASTMGTARVGRGERGAPRPSSAVEHSEDLGSVEDQLGYQRQAAWAEDWEDNNTAGVTETEGEIVGHNGGAMGAVGAVSLPGADARRLHELAEAAAGGAAEGLERNPRATAQMRRACGDPLFFAHLKEDIGTRQRGGKKFLTHEEEMDLGTKVQRYRRLTEVICLAAQFWLDW